MSCRCKIGAQKKPFIGILIILIATGAWQAASSDKRGFELRFARAAAENYEAARAEKGPLEGFLGLRPEP